MTREEKAFMLVGVSSFGVKHQEDFNITINDISVTIFWHSPSLNLGWYPIVQMEKHMEKGWKVILHREGPENPNAWQNFAKEICDFINENIKED